MISLPLILMTYFRVHFGMFDDLVVRCDGEKVSNGTYYSIRQLDIVMKVNHIGIVKKNGYINLQKV